MKFFKNIFSFFRNLLSKKEPVKMLEAAQSNNVSKEKSSPVSYRIHSCLSVRCVCDPSEPGGENRVGSPYRADI